MGDAGGSEGQKHGGINDCVGVDLHGVTGCGVPFAGTGPIAPCYRGQAMRGSPVRREREPYGRRFLSGPSRNEALVRNDRGLFRSHSLNFPLMGRRFRGFRRDTPNMISGPILINQAVVGSGTGVACPG